VVDRLLFDLGRVEEQFGRVLPVWRALLSSKRPRIMSRASAKVWSTRPMPGGGMGGMDY
jgi:hypothetical protein